MRSRGIVLPDPRSGEQLTQPFFRQSTLTVARGLLGMRLVKTERGRRLSGIITETEAYIGQDDLGCHASRGGRTPRNAVMFGAPGYAYIYFTYGMHWLLNIVTERAGFPAAVLIRAMLPREGARTMLRRRRNRSPIADGPAKLCQALALDRRWNGYDLCRRDSRLFLERAGLLPEEDIRTGPRVGLNTVPEPWKSKPWRFSAAPTALTEVNRIII
jgi:DNA-3-methyladenine glycosylase